MKIKDLNIKTDYIDVMKWGDGDYQFTSFEKSKGIETVVNISKKEVKKLIDFLLNKSKKL